MHWLWVHFLQESGSQSSSSRAYNFLSGSGSDIGELAIVGGLIATYRRVNCHSKGCPRLSHHEYEMDGVKYRLCRRHHPHAKRPQAEDFKRHAELPNARATRETRT